MSSAQENFATRDPKAAAGLGRHNGVPAAGRRDQRSFETEYGYFTGDGGEYVIVRPDTPKPWVNIICPGDYGLAVSQCGGGYSWKTHASLNRVTRWNQDLVCDNWGKFIYVRDEKTGKFWSPTWKPVGLKPQSYECRHGLGYTKFVTKNFDVQTELTLTVPPGESLEVWRMKARNLSNEAKELSFWTYFEWCLGEGPDSHREFHKTFIETELDQEAGVLYAGKRLWTISNDKGQHWNRSWEGLAWHAVNQPLRDLSGSKDAFIGAYGEFQAPQALLEGKYLAKTTGKWDDGIASLCNAATLQPGESFEIVWTLGVARDKKEASRLAKKYQEPGAADQALEAAAAFWNKVLSTTEAQTPDPAFDLLANRWLKYQALSGRIWGRTGYYQAGGAFGYRDQLQDSQIFLHIDPERTKRQILLHAAHQYPDGIVQHWWHPITEEGPRSRYSDDFLWLPFLVSNYLKETADFSILKEKVPYLPMPGGKSAPSASLYEHCLRSIENSLKKQSKRGLPLIGSGDWNDGLAVVGWEDKGETVWGAEFLYGILTDFTGMLEKAIAAKAVSKGEEKRIKSFRQSAQKLALAVNKYGWDGAWYWAASCDDGSLVGSKKSKEGKIHLNPQTWAVLNGIVPQERLPQLLDSLEKNLYKDYGPLVLHPAYKTPDERIGYLTRYAAGVRENGGLYTHAGIWAIQMECFLQRNAKAWELFTRLCPILRGMDPVRYQCEPYVTPGNVDGPDSPLYGRGGWTWYTGSAAWLYRIMTEWILGVRPEWNGLKVQPCVPDAWQEFRVTRPFRGKTYRLSFKRDRKLQPKSVAIQWQGKDLPSNVIPQDLPGKELELAVRFN